MRVSVTSRTAVYGPVCTVVWEGWSREAPPYPDLWRKADVYAQQHLVVDKHELEMESVGD
jgi:hypothetical protein